MRHSGLLIAMSVCLCSVGQVEGGLLISDHFRRTGTSESLVALFTDATGKSTQNTYSGLVEVIISGDGQSAGTLFNDAFYVSRSPSQGQIHPDLYQLNIGWSGLAYAVGNFGTNNADNFITFIDGVGAVTPPALPPYDGTSHTYNFVLDIPDISTQLTFGVNDGLFTDNTGQFNIEVFQVQEGASPIPEPSSLLLLGIGACGLCGSRRLWMTSAKTS